MQLLRQLDGFQAIGGLADHTDLGIVFQHAPEALPHQAMIVHQQYRDFIAHMSSVKGTSSRTSVPPSPGRNTSKVPCSNSARSRMAVMPMPLRVVAVTLLGHALAPIFNFQAQPSGRKIQPHHRQRRAGMARQIVQCFLQHAVHMDGHPVA